MNKSYLVGLAIAAVLGLLWLLHHYEPLNQGQLQLLALAVIALATVWRAQSIRAARRFVIGRRRLYKGFWRREASGDTALTQPEKQAIVLLGQIRAARVSALLMVAATLGALLWPSGALLGLAFALGQGVLAYRLQADVRRLEQSLPRDAQRAVPDVILPAEAATKYWIEIDIAAVHGFIQPKAALPFWSQAEAEQWLQTQFAREGSRWKADKNTLRYLDADEIVSVEER